jgi:hypothetical protein
VSDKAEAYLRSFREASAADWRRMEEELVRRRLSWFVLHREQLASLGGDSLERAYRVLLLKLGVREEEAPIVERTPDRLVFHSRNPCPALEACVRSGLDTRVVCRRLFERPAEALVRCVDPALSFGRNYARIRPYCPYCEEIIRRAGGGAQGASAVEAGARGGYDGV